MMSVRFALPAFVIVFLLASMRLASAELSCPAGLSYPLVIDPYANSCKAANPGNGWVLKQSTNYPGYYLLQAGWGGLAQDAMDLQCQGTGCVRNAPVPANNGDGKWKCSNSDCNLSAKLTPNPGNNPPDIRISWSGDQNLGYRNLIAYGGPFGPQLKPQGPLVLSALPHLTLFGDTLNLAVSGGSGSGATTVGVESGGDYCSVSDNKTLAIGKIGACILRVTKAADAEYAAAAASFALDMTAIIAVKLTPAAAK